jgi:hypothetical protein
MIFDGFKKCLYPVQKFDADSERRFAVALENDEEVLKWFKPARAYFQIHYAAAYCKPENKVALDFVLAWEKSLNLKPFYEKYRPDGRGRRPFRPP